MKKNQEVVDKPRKEKRTKHLLPWFILTSLVSVIVGLVAGWFIHISMVDAVRSDAIKTVKELSS